MQGTSNTDANQTAVSPEELKHCPTYRMQFVRLENGKIWPLCSGVIHAIGTIDEVEEVIGNSGVDAICKFLTGLPAEVLSNPKVDVLPDGRFTFCVTVDGDVLTDCFGYEWPLLEKDGSVVQRAFEHQLYLSPADAYGVLRRAVDSQNADLVLPSAPAMPLFGNFIDRLKKLVH